MFNVAEIVVYEVPEDATLPSEKVDKPKKLKLDESEPAANATRKQTLDEKLAFTANLLQYFVTPSHLRTLIFKGIGTPWQFKYAKHLPVVPYATSGTKATETVVQGIAVPRTKPKKLAGQKKLTKKNRREAVLTKYVNLGFDRLFALEDDAMVPVHSQVFVDFKTRKVVAAEQKYTVRAVSGFSRIFTESPLPDGYEQTVFVPSQQFMSHKTPVIQESSTIAGKPRLLLVFGKWSEVTASVQQDPELGIEDAADLFDGMCTALPRARLEDAVMVTLARM